MTTDISVQAIVEEKSLRKTTRQKQKGLVGFPYANACIKPCRKYRDGRFLHQSLLSRTKINPIFVFRGCQATIRTTQGHSLKKQIECFGRNGWLTFFRKMLTSFWLAWGWCGHVRLHCCGLVCSCVRRGAGLAHFFFSKNVNLVSASAHRSLANCCFSLVVYVSMAEPPNKWMILG